MKTFLANLNHAARHYANVNISGGSFSPAELKHVAETIRDMSETMAQLTFAVETVAHLRGMEQELLPMADKARALLARMEAN